MVNIYEWLDISVLIEVSSYSSISEEQTGIKLFPPIFEGQKLSNSIPSYIILIFRAYECFGIMLWMIFALIIGREY